MISKLPMSNLHGRKRSSTEKYGELWRKERPLLSSYTASVYDLHIASFSSKDDRISPYTVTEIYKRNTGLCNTTKHGRIRSVSGMYTVVHDRIRSL